MKRFIPTSLLVVTAMFAGSATAAGIGAFGPDSLKQIERDHAGRHFLLVLWSVECQPCRRELALLGHLYADRPAGDLVLVATDNIESRDLIIEILAQYHLGGVPAWAFAGQAEERLRYRIDPDWAGEMPRSYFYAPDSSRKGVSGRLEEAAVRDWLGMDN